MLELIHEQTFCLGSAHLLHKFEIKAQAQLIYKQINMNEFFIESSLSYLLIAWFIYSTRHSGLNTPLG